MQSCEAQAENALRRMYLVVLGIQLFSKEFPNQIPRGLGLFQRNHDRPQPIHTTLRTPVLYMYRGIFSRASQTLVEQGTDVESHDGGEGGDDR